MQIQSNEYGLALKHLNLARQLGLGGLPELIVHLLLYENVRLLILSRDFQTRRGIFSYLYAGSPSGEYMPGIGVAALAEPVFPENIASKDREMVVDAGASSYAANSCQTQQAATRLKPEFRS